MVKMKARLTKPEAGNKYYIRKVNGGYNPCIKGEPTDKDCNVLANCTGYSTGRFNEIGEYNECKYLGNTNAENYTNYCKTQGLELGQIPKEGSCMVWHGKGSKAGHVAIVEKVISGIEVLTSESGYGSKKIFWTQHRNKGNGNWGQNKNYTFKGFIYNPAVEDYWTKGTYKTLVSKYIRTSPKVATNNYVLVKECMASVKPKLTSQKPNDKAKYKKNVIVDIKNFVYDSKGNLWGLTKNTYFCVKDSTGNQVEKIK